MNNLGIVLFLCSFAYAASIESQCPQDWSNIDGQCYFISKEEDKVDFQGAKSKCEALNAKLIEPKTEVQNQKVHDLASNQKICHYYIGVVKLTEENE